MSQSSEADNITARKLIEFDHLSPEQKWNYLKAYWSTASKFYGFHRGLVVTDEEVEAQIRKLKEKPSPKIRRVVSLKRWRWNLDTDGRGVREGYFKHDFNDNSWEETTLPHNVNFEPANPVVFGEIDAPWFDTDKSTTIYLGEYASWYRSSIPLTKHDLEGRRVLLRFESCSIKTTAWVDEWPVILDHYGVYPFEMEITEELLKSKNDEKQLALQIVSTLSNTPDVFYNCVAYGYTEGWRPLSKGHVKTPPVYWGGINGAVEIVAVSPVYIKDLFIHTKSIGSNQANLHIRLEIENTTGDRFDGKVELDIKRWYPDEATDSEKFTLEVHSMPLSTSIVENDVQLPNPTLWESWNPTLYLTHATLWDKQPCDDLYETFGVRTFTSSNEEFLLNGRPVKLTATHDVPIYPNSSLTCPGDYWIVQDYLIHKAMGLVAARYPSDSRTHFRRIAEFADQMGIMLIWEGYCSLWSQSPDIEEFARRDVPAMIKDLRNHPSIVVWVQGDEAFYYDPAHSAYQNKRLRYVDLVLNLTMQNDPSRLIVPIGGWAEDLIAMIRAIVAKGHSVEDARKIALELLPVFNLPNVYWNVHRIPGYANTEPVYAVMERDRALLCGAGKPVTYDEFGCEGMPDWEPYKGEWWYRQWLKFNPSFTSMMVGGTTRESRFMGRDLTLDDWQVSQAYQASVNWRILSFLRESNAFAGFSVYFRDTLNYHAGVVDNGGRSKLSFFVFRNMLGQFSVSAMHGNYLFKREDKMSITISNSGPALNEGKLVVKVSNRSGDALDEKTTERILVPAGLTQVMNYDLKELQSDLYALEYYLYDQKGTELARSLDVFFVE